MTNWEITSEEINLFEVDTNGEEIPFEEADFENWLDV